MKYCELNEKAINKCLKGFKKYLYSNNKILQIDGKHADPLKENCYISSGQIPGVYFPNSIIKIVDTLFNYYDVYNFVCIGKNSNDEMGFYMSLKNEYMEENGQPKGFFEKICFLPFVPVNPIYFDIRDEIKKDISKLKNEIEILKTFKIVNKKDGSTFKNFRLNFEFLQIYKTWDGRKTTEKKNIDFSIDRDYSSFIYSFEIYFNNNFKISYSLPEEEKNKYYDLFNYLTIEKVFAIVMESLKEKENKLKQLETLFENSLKIFEKAEKAKKEYIRKKEEINKESFYYFNEYLNNRLY